MNFSDSFPGPIDGISRKRKAFDSDVNLADYDASAFPRPKLSLPRSAGLVMNGDAQFHPLPPEVNTAILAQLGHDPLSQHGRMPHSSSSSSSLASVGHEHKSSTGSDYFGTHSQRYPDVEPYPSAQPSCSVGILEPASSMSDSTDAMDMDAGSNARAHHGPHCKSIPQLCVRYNDGASSDLWATCPDCGACSKVESNQPASNLCYSP
ncbi:hypothetical protein BCV70DRAFT_164261 [Testicularia cyperi]|uniref:Uncharacterized protein n=1 Tax=Testicularia cyperi TaxID=1882483 RepID=A0A317XN53_9BASI|nr:hypothetical protein BCV70DRAFT_164261 [Testicularia cyperi]